MILEKWLILPMIKGKIIVIAIFFCFFFYGSLNSNFFFIFWFLFCRSGTKSSLAWNHFFFISLEKIEKEKKKMVISVLQKMSYVSGATNGPARTALRGGPLLFKGPIFLVNPLFLLPRKSNLLKGPLLNRLRGRAT